jgi:hypothetical protein
VSAAAATRTKEDPHGTRRPACPTKEIIHRVNEAVLQRKRVGNVYYTFSHFPLSKDTLSFPPLENGVRGISEAGRAESI